MNITKILLFTMLASPTLQAAPYIEYKSTRDLSSDKTKDYTRVGYTFLKNYYIETGTSSAEIGYKIKIRKFTLKGKIESKNDFNKNGLETEIRYTFD